MTRYELVKQNKDVLEICRINNITTQDSRNAEIYECIVEKIEAGEKVGYAIANAAAMFFVSESTAWRIFSNLRQDVTISR